MSYNPFVSVEKVLDTRAGSRRVIDFRHIKNFTSFSFIGSWASTTGDELVEGVQYKDLNVSGIKTNHLVFLVFNKNSDATLDKDNFPTCLVKKEGEIRVFARNSIVSTSSNPSIAAILAVELEGIDLPSPLRGFTNGGGSGGSDEELKLSDITFDATTFISYLNQLGAVQSNIEGIQSFLDSLSDAITTGAVNADFVAANSITTEKLTIRSSNKIYDFDSFELLGNVAVPGAKISGAGNYTAGIVDSTAWHGAKSLQVSSTGAVAFTIHPTQNTTNGWVLLDKGIYVLSAYVKSVSGSNANFSLGTKINSNNLWKPTVLTNIQEWKRIHLPFEVTSDGSYATIQFSLSGIGTYYVDGIMLEQVAEEEVDKINASPDRVSSIAALTPGQFTSGGSVSIDGGHIKTSSLNADKINTGSIDATFADIVAANIQTLDAGKIKTGTLDAEGITVVNLDAGSIKTDSLITKLASIDTAYINSAHISNGTITTALIEDGAITNAKIDNLDAGKITSGIISGKFLEIRSNNLISDFDSFEGLNNSVEYLQDGSTYIAVPSPFRFYLPQINQSVEMLSNNIEYYINELNSAHGDKSLRINKKNSLEAGYLYLNKIPLSNQSLIKVPKDGKYIFSFYAISPYLSSTNIGSISIIKRNYYEGLLPPVTVLESTLWYDSTNAELKRYNFDSSLWEVIPDSTGVIYKYYHVGPSAPTSNLSLTLWENEEGDLFRYSGSAWVLTNGERYEITSLSIPLVGTEGEWDRFYSFAEYSQNEELGIKIVLEQEDEILIDALQFEQLESDILDHLIVPSKFNPGSMTIIDGNAILTGTIEARHIQTKLIDTEGATIREAAISSAHIQDASIDSAHIRSLSAKDIKADVLDAARVYSESLVSQFIQSETLKSAFIEVDDLTAKFVSIQEADIERITARILEVDSARITEAIMETIGAYSAGLNEAFILKLQADVIDASKIKATEISTEGLTANSGLFNSFIAQDGFIQVAKIPKLTANQIDSNVVRTQLLAAAKIEATDLLVDGTITTDLIKAGAIVAGKIDVTSLLTSILQSETAFIKDAHISSLTVTDAMISSLSGDKINAGTIVADKIVIRDPANPENSVLFSINQASIIEQPTQPTPQNSKPGLVWKNTTTGVYYTYKLGTAGTSYEWVISGTEVPSILGQKINANDLIEGSIHKDLIGYRQITTDKLFVNELSGVSANLGTITAGILKGVSEKFTIDLDQGVINFGNKLIYSGNNLSLVDVNIDLTSVKNEIIEDFSDLTNKVDALSSHIFIGKEGNTPIITLSIASEGEVSVVNGIRITPDEIGFIQGNSTFSASALMAAEIEVTSLSIKGSGDLTFGDSVKITELNNPGALVFTWIGS